MSSDYPRKQKAHWFHTENRERGLQVTDQAALPDDHCAFVDAEEWNKLRAVMLRLYADVPFAINEARDLANFMHCMIDAALVGPYPETTTKKEVE